MGTNDSFQDVMNRILPPSKDYKPGVPHSDGERQGYGAKRKGRPKGHEGVDMNYHTANGRPIGQNGINKEHPVVGAPVSGKVTDINENMGLVEITDSQGFKHQIRHLHEIDVNEEDHVKAGQYIGTMGNKGTKDQHVHYGIKLPKDSSTDPEEFWNRYSGNGQPLLNARPKKMASSTFLRQGFGEAVPISGAPGRPYGFADYTYKPHSGETLRREGDQVWRIEPDGSTRGYFLSE
ncbi:MAG: M23 family metallopeptidase [Deltaproteobacteria bacterium]